MPEPFQDGINPVGGDGAEPRQPGLFQAEPGSSAFAAGRFPSPSPLFPGCPALFVQADGTHRALVQAASLVQEERMGIVFTLTSDAQNHVARVRELAEAHRQLVGPVAQVLFDANRYSGVNRRTGTSLDPRWIRVQRAAGAKILLTDSPYIPEGDRAGLASVLAEGKKLGDGVVVVLALHLSWLRKDVEFLIDAINQVGIPVALVLEHSGDPFGVQAAVAGLVRLLAEVEVPAGLLRCDLTVIGAVAFGAAFGAVGTRTGLRHLYPQPKAGATGGGRPASIGALVPASLAYRTLEKINTAIGHDLEDQRRWSCDCRFCEGRTLDWIVDEPSAFQHSLAAIALLGAGILNLPTALDRQRSWVSTCQHAQTINLEIEYDTGMSWEPPANLGGWQKLASLLPPVTPRPQV